MIPVNAAPDHLCLQKCHVHRTQLSRRSNSTHSTTKNGQTLFSSKNIVYVKKLVFECKSHFNFAQTYISTCRLTPQWQQAWLEMKLCLPPVGYQPVAKSKLVAKQNRQKHKNSAKQTHTNTKNYLPNHPRVSLRPGFDVCPPLQRH